jgi:peptidoglycan DL-endopeptidase CwlO
VQHGRKRLIGTIASAAVLAGAGMIASSPADAKPNIKDVQGKVDRLLQQAEQASEHYDATKIQIDKLKGSLKDLDADKSRQDSQLSSVREQLRASVLSQYESSGSSILGQVVTSDDPQSFLDGLSTLSSYNSVQSNLMSAYSTQVTSLDLRTSATQERLDQVTALEQQLQSDKDDFTAKLADAKQLLGTLQEQQRQEILSRGSDVRITDAPVPASGRAAAAVAYAMAQVGKAYVYGAAGPSAFDCSGLTMRAWGAAGVSLPHSSAAQFGTGPHIAEADLQPGDLVFYYSPISHVGMYIGNGLIVNAENPGVGVTVTSLHSMPYVGAVRPG